MSACPSCKGPLFEGRDDHGWLWGCPTCGGLALALAVLRKKITSPALIHIWRTARERQGTIGRPCPLCDRRMIEVSSAVGEPPVLVDVCPLCSVIWFDPGELQKLPSRPAEAPKGPLPPPVREVLDIAEAQTASRRHNSVLPDPSYDLPWEFVLDLLVSPFFYF